MIPPRKPPRLQRGDLIGVISPAAAVEAETLRRGCETIERLGWRVRVGPHALNRHRFLAGTDEERAAELMTMFRDPEVRGVFCSRAGYGSGRLLPLLDFAQLAQTPKIFLGFSDVTLLLNAFRQYAGLVCVHGPVVAGEFAKGFSSRALTHLLNLLTTGYGEPSLPVPTILRGGVAEGPLVGGCLSVLVATLGTAFALETSGTILFLEDVGEKPYRVDRMLTQLKHAGKLEDVAGVVFGEMSGCFGDSDDPALLMSVLTDIFADYAYPVGFGLPAGHGGDNFALPVGTRVRLDTINRQLTFLEPAVE